MIREGWDQKQLGDLVTFQRGHDLSKSEFVHGKYPIAGSNGIIGYHHALTTKGPSITIGRSGNLGTPYFYKDDFWAHNTTLYVKEFHNTDPKFIYYLLKTLDFTQFNSGSAVPSLNRNYIHPLEVYVPETIETQRRIADILTALDDKIELNRQTNTTLEAIAQAIFKEWFVDFNFPGATGELVESELGMIPRGWQIRSLYDSATYINGAAYKKIAFSPDRSGLPVVKINELKYGITSQTNFTNETLEPKYKILNGEILLSWSGSPDTSLDTFVWSGGPAWLNQHIFRVIPCGASETHFVYYLLRHLMPSLIEIARDKQTTGLGHITVQDMKRMQVLFPPDSVMQVFSERVAPLYDLIFNNDLESRTLVTLRDMLLPKLMSGEIEI
jgi:type I restriction enzyme S subunit